MTDPSDSAERRLSGQMDRRIDSQINELDKMLTKLVKAEIQTFRSEVTKILEDGIAAFADHEKRLNDLERSGVDGKATYLGTCVTCSIMVALALFALVTLR